MSRQLEAAREQKRAKRDSAVLLAVGGGLELALAQNGMHMTGMNVILRGESVMGVVKVFEDGVHKVAFVGAEDIEGLFIKAYREAVSDKLRWKEDKYRGPGTIDEKEK